MVTEVAMEERVIAKDEREMMIAREKSLLWLLKRTANKIDDILAEFTSLDDLHKTRMEFKAVLGALSFVETRERSSGKEEEELGYLSIKRFKRTALTRFGEAVVLLNRLVERECSPDLKADSEERCEPKLEDEAGSVGVKPEADLPEENDKVAKELLWKKQSSESEEENSALDQLSEVEYGAMDQLEEAKKDQCREAPLIIDKQDLVEVSIQKAEVMLHTMKAETVQMENNKQAGFQEAEVAEKEDSFPHEPGACAKDKEEMSRAEAEYLEELEDEWAEIPGLALYLKNTAVVKEAAKEETHVGVQLNKVEKLADIEQSKVENSIVVQIDEVKKKAEEAEVAEPGACAEDQKAEEVKASSKPEVLVTSSTTLLDEMMYEEEEHSVADLKIDKKVEVVDFKDKEEKLYKEDEAEAKLIHTEKAEAVEEVRMPRPSKRESGYEIDRTMVEKVIRDEKERHVLSPLEADKLLPPNQEVGSRVEISSMVKK